MKEAGLWVLVWQEIRFSIWQLLKRIRRFPQSCGKRSVRRKLPVSRGAILRRDEMRRLRFDGGLTLQEIGERFGVSRQRVFQILGRTGRIRKY